MAKLQLAATTEIKIEKGVPMPAKYGKRMTYPYNDMEVGDSFEFPTTSNYRTGCYNSAATATLRLAPKKFTAKLQNGKARIWRIA